VAAFPHFPQLYGFALKFSETRLPGVWLNPRDFLRTEAVMTTAAECREYAHECARWAAEAKSDEMRQAYLDMANHFLAAALKLDGLITPQTKSAA
jgi:hypothetical protein